MTNPIPTPSAGVLADEAPFTEVQDDDPDHRDGRSRGMAALTIGAIGVVYGDIGTSPLYALREALRPVARDGLTRGEVLGVISLLIWALIIIVTVKYVLILLRADNRGEGGVLALFTLTRLAIGRRSIPVLALAIAGAALFFGDAIITPAISVLSAVEGIGLVAPHFEGFVLPVTVGILMALFMVQRHGTGAISFAFGPVTVLWFLTMATTGVLQMVGDPAVLASFDPRYGIRFVRGTPSHGLRRAGRGVPGGDGGRGALCRSGPFRPPPDHAGLVRAGVSGAGAELPRPGRTGAARSHRAVEPVLPRWCRRSCCRSWWRWQRSPRSSPRRR